MATFYSIIICSPTERYVVPVKTKGMTREERRQAAVKKYERVADALRRAGGESTRYIFMELPLVVLARFSEVIRMCGAGNITVKLMESERPFAVADECPAEFEAARIISELAETMGDGYLTFEDFVALNGPFRSDECSCSRNKFSAGAGGIRRTLFLVK